MGVAGLKGLGTPAPQHPASVVFLCVALFSLPCVPSVVPHAPSGCCWCGRSRLLHRKHTVQVTGLEHRLQLALNKNTYSQKTQDNLSAINVCLLPAYPLLPLLLRDFMWTSSFTITKQPLSMPPLFQNLNNSVANLVI